MQPRPAPRPTRWIAPTLGGLALTAALVATVPAARGVERTFAGSAQVDYLLVPSAYSPRDFTLDGFTTELSLRLAADFSESVTFNVKTCFGCHGFEIGVAAADIRIHEAFNLRVGRFSPAFGDFPARHDPANHRTSDKPLPYDMGRMLRLQEWNMSVLPAPYVDNGVELFGRTTFADDFDLDWNAYVIGGLKGGSDALDVDFIQSRSLYYVDNNSQPSVGGRLALSWRATDDLDLKLGVSGLAGTYDPDRQLGYAILGADFVAKLDRLTLRAEYLVRRTEMALGDDPASRFLYGPGEDGTYADFFLKDGFYVESDFLLSRRVELVARWDGLRRLGNVVVTSPLRKESALMRYTAGVNFVFDRSLRVKVSGELYDFSDFEDEIALHLGFVGAF